MASYIVRNAVKTADRPDKGYGPMQEIELVLQEYGQAEEISASWYTKRETALPDAGSRIEGELEPSQFGLKFKKAKGAGGGFRGGGGKSPEERRSIAMQSSAARAVEIVRIAVDAGLWKPETPEAVTTAALRVADRVFDRVQKAEAGS